MKRLLILFCVALFFLPFAKGQSRVLPNLEKLPFGLNYINQMDSINKNHNTLLILGSCRGETVYIIDGMLFDKITFSTKPLKNHFFTEGYKKYFFTEKDLEYISIGETTKWIPELNR